MSLSFTCQGCGKKLRGSYDTDPEHGEMRMARWYNDDGGLNHFAMVCLICGCVHDTSGSAARTLGMLMGRMPLKVHGFVTLTDLATRIAQSAPAPEMLRFIAIRRLGLPEEIVDALIERRLLNAPLPAGGDAR